jgi:molybdopterin-guanine dinucleotide biosynthesis protein A
MPQHATEGNRADVTGVVLAGGQSRRMGRDKALIELGGETLLVRAARVLATVTGEVLVVGRPPGEPGPVGARLVADVYPGLGPLGGIVTALRAMHTPLALVVACDMPLLQAALIRYLIGLASEYEAVVPRTEQGPEPLHAVYSAACLPAAEACLADGERAVSALLTRVRTRYVPRYESAPYDPSGLSFLNANTPEEWQRILASLVAAPSSTG